MSDGQSRGSMWEDEWSATLTPRQVLQLMAPEWADLKDGDVVLVNYEGRQIGMIVSNVRLDEEGHVTCDMRAYEPEHDE